MSEFLLPVCFFIIALLYSIVGHAGASGYLAIMTLFGVATEVMKPVALVLNIFVAAIASTKFTRAGHFSWPLFWPFALGSIPFSFIGGAITLSPTFYKPIVGIILLYGAYQLFRFSKISPTPPRRPVSLQMALLLGSGIGLLSGLLGVGGGIFLSPLILLMTWGTPHQTAGVSAVFILVNSISGLLGHVSSVVSLPSEIPLWTGAVIAGGWTGAHYGSRRLSNTTLKRFLALILLIAGLKLILF